MIRIKYQCSQRPTAGRINEQVVLREQFSVYSGGTVTALLGRRNKACQMTDTLLAKRWCKCWYANWHLITTVLLMFLQKLINDTIYDIFDLQPTKIIEITFYFTNCMYNPVPMSHWDLKNKNVFVTLLLF